MQRQLRLGRLLAAGIVAVAVASQLTAAAQAGPAEPTVPPEIAVEDGHKLFLVGHAVGVQIVVTVLAPQKSSVSNTATVASATPDPHAANNSATITTP